MFVLCTCSLYVSLLSQLPPLPPWVEVGGMIRFASLRFSTNVLLLQIGRKRYRKAFTRHQGSFHCIVVHSIPFLSIIPYPRSQWYREYVSIDRLGLGKASNFGPTIAICTVVRLALNSRHHARRKDSNQLPTVQSA